MSVLVFDLNIDETDNTNLLDNTNLQRILGLVPIFDTHDVSLSKYYVTCRARIFLKCSFCQALLIYEDHLSAIS